MSKLQVCRDQCNECLFGPNKIVTNARKQQILKDCLANQEYFICHVASPEASLVEEGEHVDGVMCKGFYDTLGTQINLVRIAQRLGTIEEVSVND